MLNFMHECKATRQIVTQGMLRLPQLNSTIEVRLVSEEVGAKNEKRRPEYCRSRTGCTLNSCHRIAIAYWLGRGRTGVDQRRLGDGRALLGIQERAVRESKLGGGSGWDQILQNGLKMSFENDISSIRSSVAFEL
jgi:hypothetical protein